MWSMNPEHPSILSPGGTPYEFILNPASPPKRTSGPGIGGNAFLLKLVFIIGGAIVLMIVIGVAANIFLGNRTNLGTLVGIAQSQTELTRIATNGVGAD